MYLYIDIFQPSFSTLPTLENNAHLSNKIMQSEDSRSLDDNKMIYGQRVFLQTGQMKLKIQMLSN